VLIATYASAALICAASILVGRAILCVLGRDAWSGLEPPLGLGALVAICSVTIRLPHRATTTLVVLVALLLASAVYLRGRAIPRTGLGLAAVAGLLTLLFASLPFIASGHVSVLGIGVNNDLAGHLDYTAWVTDPVGEAPPTIRHGYPLGPHGLAAAICKGLGFEPLSALLGLVLAIPVLTALTAAAVLRELRPGVRVVAAVLTGLAYLAAATLAVGGFKETIMGLLVLGFSLGLRELTAGEGERRGLLVALGVLMAGMLGVYSYPGLIYAFVIGLLWAVIELVAAHRRGEGPETREAIRRAAPMALIPLGVLALITLAELPRVLDFARSGTVGYVQNAASRLHETASPFEALGVWPSSDYLLGTAGLDSYLVFAIIGVAALEVGVMAAVRRADRALIAGLAGVVVVYVLALLNGGFYVQAKALAIVAPLASLLILWGLLGGRTAQERDTSLPALLKAGLAIAFVAIAAYSSFLALRDARVAPRQYAQAQLGAFRPIVHGKQVLSLTSDRFTDYYLRGATVLSPAPFAEALTVPRQGKFHHLPVDFDSVVSAALDRFDYAVTTSAAYRSAAPPSYKPVARTEDFVLWKRVGKSPQTGILPEEERPGSRYNCHNPKLTAIVKHAAAQGYDTARVQPMSVVGKRFLWKPETSAGDGDTISQTLHLAPGRWQLSIQYYSPLLELTVEADGLRRALPRTADGGVRYRTDQGPFWPIGEVVSTGKPIKVSVSAGGLSGLQKLLGADQRAEIGNVTAAQPDKAREIPLTRACNAYIDHFTVGPG
jgi:hypothetical protein